MHGHDSDKYDCGISIVPLARGIGSNLMLEHAAFAQLMHMPHCALGCLGPLKPPTHSSTPSQLIHYTSTETGLQRLDHMSSPMTSDHLRQAMHTWQVTKHLNGPFNPGLMSTLTHNWASQLAHMCRIARQLPAIDCSTPQSHASWLCKRWKVSGAAAGP